MYSERINENWNYEIEYDPFYNVNWISKEHLRRLDEDYDNFYKKEKESIENENI